MSSRQFEYQQRHRALGLCVLCSRPAVTKLHCAVHLVGVRRRMAASTRRWRAKQKAPRNA